MGVGRLFVAICGVAEETEAGLPVELQAENINNPNNAYNRSNFLII
jgi:hypothetical protein